MENEILINKAIEAMKNSYSPYSNFRVGASLITKNGKIYTGCNIENSSFSATNCAERTAFFNAVSNGEKEFEAIAIVGGKNGKIDDFCFPCGICRQVMSEFCDKDFKIILSNTKEIKEYKLSELLPESFKLED
ncbi:MAG: cytidine deaminase [Ruminococcus sp.]|nr:cytidine deaminase [Candidatus Copronaster equi]